jgi:L-threonylcarbamoyladenylate synthase
MIYTNEIVKKIKEGNVGVIPTDTIYGFVCDAFNKNAIEKIYEIKKRDSKKPFVYLIGDIGDLEKLDIKVNFKIKNTLDEYWPGPFSIIFDCKNTPEFIHRGLGSVAIRMPADPDLKNLLNKTGPLASTSVNTEGDVPADSIEMAKKYFEENSDVNFYIDGGELKNNPSKIIKLNKNGEIEFIR